MTIVDQEILINRALIELDEELYSMGVEPFDLKVVGGYALILETIRHKNEMTDIDYVGPDLSREVAEVSNRIGMKYGLGSGWINNDVLLTDGSIESLSIAVGVPLRFTKAFELSVITVYRLDAYGLLCMKLNAIDTSLVATEYEGAFTRKKDFPDIIALKNKLGLSWNDLRDAIEWLSGCSGVDMIMEWERLGDSIIETFVSSYRTQLELELSW